MRSGGPEGFSDVIMVSVEAGEGPLDVRYAGAAEELVEGGLRLVEVALGSRRPVFLPVSCNHYAVIVFFQDTFLFRWQFKAIVW